MYAAFFLTLFFLYLTVKFGLNKGIDKVNKYASILFVIFLVVLFGYACSTPGFIKAIHYLFSADLSMVSYKVVVFAFAHALFSLSLGLGILLTYSSYSDKENLNPTIYGVVGINIIVSLIVGVIVYSYLYSFGLSETAGPKLIFEVLPLIFNSLPILGLIFFLLVFFAGFTSMISMFELIISSLKDYLRISREKLDRVFILLLTLFCLLPLLYYDSIEVLDTVFGSYLTIFCALIFLVAIIFFTKEYSFLKRRIYKLYHYLFYIDILVLIVLFVISFFI
jgi:NSS family neurotransmitter:Na+ symporter